MATSGRVRYQARPARAAQANDTPKSSTGRSGIPPIGVQRFSLAAGGPPFGPRLSGRFRATSYVSSERSARRGEWCSGGNEGSQGRCSDSPDAGACVLPPCTVRTGADIALSRARRATPPAQRGSVLVADVQSAA
ncbi:hypothetical protein GCM10009612_71260 [Streptomyces beijiangensis]